MWATPIIPGRVYQFHHRGNYFIITRTKLMILSLSISCGPPRLYRGVSTNSTTGAIIYIITRTKLIILSLSISCGPPRLYRGVSTNSTTGAINDLKITCLNFGVGHLDALVVSIISAIFKKNPPPIGQEDFWSGRPGSNRPPRPWQGRALPNELLPH